MLGAAIAFSPEMELIPPRPGASHLIALHDFFPDMLYTERGPRRESGVHVARENERAHMP